MSEKIAKAMEIRKKLTALASVLVDLVCRLAEEIMETKKIVHPFHQGERCSEDLSAQIPPFQLELKMDRNHQPVVKVSLPDGSHVILGEGWNLQTAREQIHQAILYTIGWNPKEMRKFYDLLVEEIHRQHHLRERWAEEMIQLFESSQEDIRVIVREGTLQALKQG